MMCPYQKRDRCGMWICGARDGRCKYPNDSRYTCPIREKIGNEAEFESEYLPYLTLLSTVRYAKRREEKSAQEAKGLGS